MSFGRVLAGLGITVGSGVAGGALVGGLGAACGAASGAAGAAILTAAGHAGHSVHEATVMSATGNGILYGSAGAIAGLAAGGAAALGLFGSSSGSSEKSNNKSNCCIAVATYVGTQVLGGMIGYGVLSNAVNATESFGNYVADVAVGAAVTGIPLSIGLVCCIGILGGAAMATAYAVTKAVEACGSEDSCCPTRPGV